MCCLPAENEMVCMSKKVEEKQRNENQIFPNDILK